MLLDDIADYLSTQGVGTVATDLFKSIMPDAPDDCIALFESGGHDPLHTMGAQAGQAVLERPTLQVLCRSSRYDSARALALQVDQVLNGARDLTINGISYQWIVARHPPIQLGRDANNRHEISCNYDIAREMATSS